MEATISSSTKPLLPSRASYACSLSHTNDELKSFRSFLLLIYFDQSNTRHLSS
ncbi:hypothetical protein B296_00041603 [Ensete ventricosum]|uniref:Uncharacterized protein n=1 Tax=Ensete ventricosum TaxID=4639 RepID=A0A426Z5C4_ENSVE|nr:hypothetical protein B296_00041603 [Ensete ventricosum]